MPGTRVPANEARGYLALIWLGYGHETLNHSTDEQYREPVGSFEMWLCDQTRLDGPQWLSPAVGRVRRPHPMNTIAAGYPRFPSVTVGAAGVFCDGVTARPLAPR